MVYKHNGKAIVIPDDVIANNMQKLSITKEEAIELFLDDEELTENAEQQALTQKAESAVKTSNIIKAQSAPKPKTQRERVTKPDELKENIIDTIAKSLILRGGTVQVEDKRKLIIYTVGDEEFKVNLTRTRKKKGGE